jgi:2-oxoglutarate ferredoxin oxidoreductase subunit alpha
MVRGGPGLGGIQPSQCDYFQATRGGGNGDYRLIVYAPNNLQEAADIMSEAFDTSDYYRVPVMVLGDGMIGQMMEPVEIRKPEKKRNLPAKDWATTGTKGKRKPNIINSLYLDPEKLEKHNFLLEAIYNDIRKNEVRSESYNVKDADVVCVSYGTTSRVVKSAIAECEQEGLKVGYFGLLRFGRFPIRRSTRSIRTAKGSCAWK